ncbi:MAG: glutathione S-transferase family protein [Caulobacterales bacterium]
MLQIFHVPRTRSVRVIWLAEEMGIPYEIRPEQFGQPSPAFLAANPLGALPGIVDGDVHMGESTAILLYLTERYGPTPLALKLGDPRYPDYLQFVIFGEASMAAFMNPVLATQFRAPDDQKQNFTVDMARGMFSGRLKALEAQLGKGDYLAGDFTAADISVGYALGLGQSVGVAPYPPVIVDYFSRLKARPAFQAAMAK